VPADRLRRLIAARPAPAGTDERVAALPRDPTYAVPLPFVCHEADGSGSVTVVRRSRVTQCALSRICALCGDSLDTPPLVLVGTREEAAAAAYSLPPFHAGCAEALEVLLATVPPPVLGLGAPARAWVLTPTGGFEHVRPVTPGEAPVFVPNSEVPRI